MYFNLKRILGHLDGPLLAGVLALCALSMALVYSAGGEQIEPLYRQAMRIGVALLAMLVVAQVPPATLREWAPFLYFGGLLLLLAVLTVGIVGKGAQRWLDIGLLRFQPAELMKIAVPMMLACLLSMRPLPSSLPWLGLALLVIAAPVWLVIKQPDLGTSILIGLSGMVVIFLAGLRWRWIAIVAALLAGAAPALWSMLHEYQKQRILTLFNPWDDPLGAGYHIIQSTIAIGSGGAWGKGWLHGSQSQLEFIPERSTDFIFSVLAEEFGLAGVLLLFALNLLVALRGMWIALYVHSTFSRLLVGCLAVTVFINFFVNVGMVSGILPVVGMPLPLVSYGGTSMLILMAGFGVMMSIRTHPEKL